MGWRECLKYNTNLEKRLIFFVTLLSVTILVLFTCMLASVHESGVCNSPECVRAATHILDTIDQNVDPCDNFYQFACGTFVKNAFSLGQSSTLHYLKSLMKNKLKEIVIQANDERNMSRTLVMQRKFYRACMDEKAISNDSNVTFLKLLDELVGGWPILKPYTWVERDFDWTKTMIKARHLGFIHEFYFSVGIYVKDNSSMNLLWIKPPSRADISSFHWKEQNINSISQIASDLGANSVDTVTHLRRTLYFAEQLHLITEKHNNLTLERKDDKIKKIKIKDLDHTYIKLDWFDLLKNLTGLQLKKDDLVVFDVEDYFRELYYLLMKTPKKIQANYIVWAVIATNTNFMTKSIREKFRNILKSANNTNADLDRSETCYKISIRFFRNVAEGEYIRRYTPPEKKDSIKEIIKNIKRELEMALRENTWMDKETRNNAIQHLKNITESIGWSGVVYDARKFERYFGYHHLKLRSDKLINMAREMALYELYYFYRHLTYSINDEAEEYLNIPKLEVNAYYMQYFNKLVLLTPILQGLVFDERRPHYMNYGSLGSIIGHEFIHGFTETSSFGRFKNDTWWTNKTTENFNKVKQCLINEFDSYMKQLNRDKENKTLLDENLADFTGVNLAYTAYQNWAQHNRQEENLPGIKFTPNQVFWIMASTYLCSETKEADAKLEGHAPPSFRVIGRLKNSPHFAKDFNCPVGSKMNPQKKCRIFA